MQEYFSAPRFMGFKNRELHGFLISRIQAIQPSDENFGEKEEKRVSLLHSIAQSYCLGITQCRHIQDNSII